MLISGNNLKIVDSFFYFSRLIAGVLMIVVLLIEFGLPTSHASKEILPNFSTGTIKNKTQNPSEK